MSEIKCPNCGGDVRYYHNPGRTWIVCKEKCQGWKVIKVINRERIKLKTKPWWRL
jgi:ssDNA-binding Zn-finger/Zn-ribbon topoisomerase 1